MDECVFYALMFEDNWYGYNQILSVFSNRGKAEEYKKQWIKHHKREAKDVRLFITAIDVDPTYKEFT